MNQNIRCRLEGDRQVVTLRKGRFAIISITTVLVLCIASQVALVSASAAYQDEFTSSPLQSFWTFTNPATTGSYSFTNPGYLTITAAQNSRMGTSGTSNRNAPRILQSVTDNFDASTYVTGSFTADNYRGGILLWKDNSNFIALEKYGSDKAMIYTGATDNNQQKTYTATNSLYLRLVKSGATVTGYYSTDGSTWVSIGFYSFSSSDPLQIGLFTFNGDASTTTSTFSVKFDYFHITPYSILSVLPEYPVGIFGAAAAIAGGYVFFKAKNRAKPISF
jgi:regulation of enolase protein 1 (concanavalin A-like superfamily)